MVSFSESVNHAYHFTTGVSGLAKLLFRNSVSVIFYPKSMIVMIEPDTLTFNRLLKYSNTGVVDETFVLDFA